MTTEKVTYKAVADFSDVFNKARKAREEHRKLTDETEKSSKSFEDATKREEASTNKFSAALRRMGDAHRKATGAAAADEQQALKLAAARRDVDIATVRAERASMKLADAENKVRDVEKSAAADSDRVARARLNLADATNRLGAANDDLRVRSQRLVTIQKQNEVGAGRLEKAMKSMGSGFGRAAQGIRDFRTVIKLLAIPAVTAAVYLLVGAIDALAAGAVGLISALGPLTGVIAALPGAIAVLLQSIGVLVAGFAGIGDAVKAVIEVEKDGAEQAEKLADTRQKAARAIVAAQEAVSDAHEAVSDAERNLADAHDETREAQEDLTDARDDARRSLMELRREVERQWLTEEQAALSVEEARRNLDEVMKDADSTSLDRRQAILALQEAEWAYNDTLRDGRRNRKDLADAEKKGVEGSDQVVDARKRVRDAIEAESDAQEALRDAMQGVKDAQQGVKDAVEAQSEAIKQQTAAQEKLAEAFESLSPAARSFARFLASLKPLLDEVRKVAQEGLLPGVEAGLRRMVTLWPDLRDEISDTASVFGDLAERFGTMLASGPWRRDLQTILGRNNRLIEMGGEATLNFADSLRHIMVAAGPFLRWLTRMVLTFSEWAAERSKVNRFNSDIKDFLERTREALEQWGRIFRNIGQALIGTGQAAREFSQWFMDAIERVTQEWAEWANSIRGQNDMKDWFERSKAPLSEMARLIRELSRVWANVASGPGVAPMIAAITDEFLPALERLLTSVGEGFGPELIALIANVTDMLALISGQGGTFTAFLQVLNKFFEAIIWIGEEVPGATKAMGAFFALQGSLMGIGAVVGIVTKVTGPMRLLSRTMRGLPVDAEDAKKGMAKLGGALRRFGGWVSDKVLPSLKGLGRSAVDAGKRFILGARDLVKAAAIWVAEHAKMAGASIAQAAKTAWAWTVSTAQSLARGIANLIRAAGIWIAQHVRMAIATAIQAARIVAAQLLMLGPIGLIIAAVVALAIIIWRNWDKIKRWITSAVRVIWSAIKAAWEWIKSATAKLWNWAWKFIKGVWEAILKYTLIGTIVDMIVSGWDWIKDKTSAVWDWVTDRLKGFWEWVRGAFERGVDAIGRLWDKIREFVSKPVEFVINTIVDDWLIGNMNKVLGFLKLPKIPRVNIAFASGGRVPGSGNRDTVPAMLTPGEFVLRKSVVKKIGTRRLERLNEEGSFYEDDPVKRRRKRYAAGGLVKGKHKLLELFYPENDPEDHDDHLHAAVDPEVVSLAQWIIGLNRGFYVAEGPGEFGPVTPGAHSPTGYHYTNPVKAIDVNQAAGSSPGEQSALNKLAKQIEDVIGGGGGILGWAGRAIGAAVAKFGDIARKGAAATLEALFRPVKGLLRNIPGLPDNGLFRDMIVGFPSNAMDQMVEWIRGKEGVGITGSAPSTAAQKYAKALLASEYGWEEHWGALQKLWQGESGWDPTAQNPVSTAYGIAQFLDSTWGLVGATKTSDPVKQIQAGLKYIKAVYGDPTKAYQAWNSRDPHWYAKGGIVIGPPFGDDKVPAYLTPGEFVVRKDIVSHVGADRLAALNEGQTAIQALAGGGLVQPVGMMGAGSAGGVVSSRGATYGDGAGLSGVGQGRGPMQVTVETDGRALTRTVQTHSERLKVVLSDRD